MSHRNFNSSGEIGQQVWSQRVADFDAILAALKGKREELDDEALMPVFHMTSLVLGEVELISSGRRLPGSLGVSPMEYCTVTTNFLDGITKSPAVPDYIKAPIYPTLKTLGQMNRQHLMATLHGGAGQSDAPKI